MSESKKQALIQQIEDSEKLEEREKDWIFDKYMPALRRQGVKASGTQANYLQAIRKLLEKNDTSILEVQDLEEKELKELNESVADRIQGSTTKRRKNHLWTTWKRALQVQGLSTQAHKDWMPAVKFTEEKGKVNRQADTKPEDLPTPSQAKEFVEKIGHVSGETTQLRNQALILLLWDKGPRIGEALNLKMRHVHVQGK